MLGVVVLELGRREHRGRRHRDLRDNGASFAIRRCSSRSRITTRLTAARSCSYVTGYCRCGRRPRSGLLAQQRTRINRGAHVGQCLVVTLNERLDYFGQTVNLAARVQGLAAENDIYMSDEIYR